MNHISTQVDMWIAEEELPPHPHLRPIREFDGLYPEDEDERQAYFDFIHWAMSREHEVLLSIPKPVRETDFWAHDIDEFGNDVSAFNTTDFKRLYPDLFNRYQYRLKKVFERVKDLAETYSCISQEAGRKNIHQRFKDLVDQEFRDQAKLLLKTYREHPHLVNKVKLFDRVAEANRHIRKCRQIWRTYANQG